MKLVVSFYNVSDPVECFTAILQGLMDLLIPLHRIRVKQRLTPWAATINVISARRARDGLHHQALRTGYLIFGNSIGVLIIKQTNC